MTGVPLRPSAWRWVGAFVVLAVVAPVLSLLLFMAMLAVLGNSGNDPRAVYYGLLAGSMPALLACSVHLGAIWPKWSRVATWRGWKWACLGAAIGSFTVGGWFVVLDVSVRIYFSASGYVSAEPIYFDNWRFVLSAAIVNAAPGAVCALLSRHMLTTLRAGRR